MAADLENARRFSICMGGAALLYNLLVAEAYEAAGHTEAEPRDYREALASWAHSTRSVRRWDRSDMWSRLIEHNARIATNSGTRHFIDAWVDYVLAGRAPGAADDREMRELVARREKAVKATQSRLLNDKLLARWRGQSGTANLVFRWPQVRRLLTDIHDGLEVDHAAAA